MPTKAFKELQKAWDSLSDKERAVGEILLVARRIYGLPSGSGRGWTRAYFDAVRELFGEVVFAVEEVGGEPTDILGLFDED